MSVAELNKMIVDAAYQSGYVDGTANRPAKCDDPDYMDGWYDGQFDRFDQVLDAHKGRRVA